MPSDKSPTVSFNQWLSLQQTGPFATMAKEWKTTRGRLTQASVVARATAVGIDPSVAAEAYSTYQTAVNPSV